MSSTANAPCPGCFRDKPRVPLCPSCGFDESTQRIPIALPFGTMLHEQYRIGRVLGKLGGFGITYLALDTRLDLRVAIKEYLPRDFAAREGASLTVSAHSGEDSAMFRYGLDVFLREARTLAKFDHPNLVRVRNVFEENATAYLVMDYYEGESLQEYLDRRGGHIGETDALAIMLPILGGLDEVHRHGFLHRDIKPHNLYLSRTGRPILLDFGAARLAIGERSRSLSIMLTPGYAPFEQYHRRGRQGPWTDVYACAAVLYHMTTGEAPPEAPERIDDDALRDPRERAPLLTPRFAAALLHGLATEPARRTKDMESFRTELTGQATPKQSSTSPDMDPEHTRVGPIGASLDLTNPHAEIPRGETAGRSRVPASRSLQTTRRRGAFWIGLTALIGGAVLLSLNRNRSPTTMTPEGGAIGDAALTPTGQPVSPAAGEFTGPDESSLAATPRPGTAFRDCPDCPEMVVIPSGRFTMGSPDDEPGRAADEGPRHEVVIAEPFALAKYEVSRNEFSRFVRDTGRNVAGCDEWKKGSWKRDPARSWQSPGFQQSGEDPVVCTNWEDARAFAVWLANRTHQAYRLPSEAEWEYAARQGQALPYYWYHDGGAPSEACAHANVGDRSARGRFSGWTVYDCDDGHVYTAPVGSYKPNGFGLYDIHGNAWEWVEDCWHASYEGAAADGLPWLGGDCSSRMLRGGGWVDSAEAVRAANRDHEAPNVRGTLHGFRLARSLAPTRAAHTEEVR